MTWNGASTVMIKSTTKVVCDAGPVIHLDELNCLDLLTDFQEIVRTLAEIPLKSTLYINPALLKEIIIKVKTEFYI